MKNNFGQYCKHSKRKVLLTDFSRRTQKSEEQALSIVTFPFDFRNTWAALIFELSAIYVSLSACVLCHLQSSVSGWRLSAVFLAQKAPTFEFRAPNEESLGYNYLTLKTRSSFHRKVNIFAENSPHLLCEGFRITLLNGRPRLTGRSLYSVPHWLSPFGS